MGRRVEILLADPEARAIASLLEDKAPVTCDMVWRQLPYTGEIYSARWGGRHVSTCFPAPHEPLMQENATIFATKGDLIFFHVRPGSEDILRDRELMSPNGVGDLSIFYARISYLMGPSGHVSGNLFATITEGLEAFVTACNHIWRWGPGRVILQRAGG